MRLIILFLALFLFSCTFNTSVDMPDEKMEVEATAAGSAPTSSGSERFRLSSGAGPKAKRGPAAAADPVMVSATAPNPEAAATARVGSAMPAPKPGPVSSQLTTASMAFNVIDKANIEDVIKVQLLINPVKAVEDLKKELTVAGKTTTAQVKISKIVIASLAAPSFKITKITPEQQILIENGTTEWLWKLEPTEVGNHEIEVTITAVIKIDGDSTTHHIRTYDHTIKVEITPKQLVDGWFKAHWEWLFSTLLFPLGIWFYARYRKKKKSKPVESGT